MYSEVEDTVIENSRKQMTPSAFEGQSTGPRRLACNFIPSPAEDEVSSESRLGDTASTTQADKNWKARVFYVHSGRLEEAMARLAGHTSESARE